MAKQKCLQKFTDFEKIFEQENVSNEDMQKLTDADFVEFLKSFVNKCNTILKKSTGNNNVELLNLVSKFEDKVISHLSTGNFNLKNYSWSCNQRLILSTLSTKLQEYGRMPSMVELADLTGLSRQTINKHLKDFENNPLHIEHYNQFKFLATKVLASLFSYAIQGDTKACIAYLKVVGMMNTNTTQQPVNNTQNNYIQINGLTITQNALDNLNSEQLEQLQSILITKALSK
jgi:DNA-binding transcriptional regulator YhcF (GntR family)